MPIFQKMVQGKELTNLKFRFSESGHTTQLPEVWLIGPSEKQLESDMEDSLDFFSSEFWGDRFADFCVHTPRFSGNRLKKVGRLRKIRKWDDGNICSFAC